MSNSTAAQIQSLQNSISDMWQPTKTQMEGEQVDIALLKAFFKNWDDAMKKGETNEGGYHTAVSKLPKDNPNTPFNEEMTESQLKDKIKKAFGKPLDELDKYDVDRLENDINALQKTVRKFLAYGNFCDDQIKNLNNKIDQLNKATQEPMYGESPNAGSSDEY